MSENGKSNTEQNPKDTKELAREIHWVERVTMWSQIGLAIIGLFGLWVYHGQLSVMKGQFFVMQGQLDVMRHDLETADRPWIKIIKTKPLKDLEFGNFNTKTNAASMISITAKNIGKSVALNVTVRGLMTFTEESQALDQEEMAVCKGKIGTLPTPILTVFPEDDTGDSWSIFSVQDLPSKIVQPTISVMDAPFFTSPQYKLISPKFIGCVVYTYPTSKVLHHSGFRFGLEYDELPPKGVTLDFIEKATYSRDPHHIIRWFEVGKDIPVKQLRTTEFFAGFSAD